MSPKPDPRGFKPGANMPDGDYDPKQQGMSESGNHAVGNRANDNPGNQQQDQQSAAAAATAATHRDKTTGARADDSTKNNREGGKR